MTKRINTRATQRAAVAPVGGVSRSGEGLEDGPLAAYSVAHGDPVTWSSADFETYENLAAAIAAANGTGEAGR